MIYLDNGATTSPFDEALSAADAAAREGYFNPSSLYAQAMTGERLLRGAGEAVRGALGARGGAVVFTSGGTEADNLAILGVAARLRRKGRFLYGAAEHSAVARAMEAVRAMGHEVERLPVDENGAILIDILRERLREEATLVSAQHVNNEVGAINDPGAIAGIVRDGGGDALLHSDGVQAFLRVSADMAGVDLYAVSAHKAHGPRGIGALWVGERARLSPILQGGGQQGGLRSGTENVPGAEGMRAAIEAMRAIESLPQRLMAMKLRLYERIMDALPDASLNGPEPERGAPHILNMSFGVKGEVLLHALEGEGILVSTGSACSSRRRAPSDTLTAMGRPPEAIDGAIRFSLSPMNTMQEMEETAAALARLVPQYRRYRRK